MHDGEGAVATTNYHLPTTNYQLNRTERLRQNCRSLSVLTRSGFASAFAIDYFASAAVTSARTWRRAFGTRCAVLETTFESFDGFASYSS